MIFAADRWSTRNTPSLRNHDRCLGATSGQHLTVEASGPDAREAVAALIAILSEATKVGG